MRRAGLRRFLDSLLIGLQLGADKSISGQTLTGNSVIVSIELVAVAGGTAGCLVERLSLPLSSEISAIPVGTEWVVAKRRRRRGRCGGWSSRRCGRFGRTRWDRRRLRRSLCFRWSWCDCKSVHRFGRGRRRSRLGKLRRWRSPVGSRRNASGGRGNRGECRFVCVATTRYSQSNCHTHQRRGLEHHESPRIELSL